MRNPWLLITSVVIPAKAGTQCHNWVPAFAGMAAGGKVTSIEICFVTGPKAFSSDVPGRLGRPA